MSSTVTVGNLEISSNNESASEMVEVLKPTEDKGKEPRVVEDKGRPVKEPDNALSKAASELGKKGGEAAAEARKKAEKDEPKPSQADKAIESLKDQAKAEGPPEERHRGDPKFDSRARIQELAHERAEARARAAELEARLARLEAERGGGKAEPAKAGPAGDDGPPKVDDFEKYEDWIDALTDWKMDRRVERIREEEGQRQQHQAQAEEVVSTVDTFRERLNKDPDIMEQLDPRLLDLKPTFMLQPGEAPGPANVLADEWIASEIAPQLGRYLSEHEEEVIRILRLPNAREIARAVARLEDKLSAGTEPPAPEPPAQEERPRSSTAPPPIKPVTPSSAPVTEDVYGEGIDFDTFVKRRKKG